MNQKMQAAPDVSVISPSRNEAAHLPAFLNSLLSQELGGLRAEFLIADGDSSDGSRRILEEYARRDPRIRVLDNPGRIVSTGLNLAIRASRSSILLRMDVHAEYAPDYIRRCVETLMSGIAENTGGAPRIKTRTLREKVFAAGFRSRFAVGGARSHDETYEGYLDSVCFGCWRRETLETLGLYDESLVRNQDDELNLRLSRAGGRIWQSPRIVWWYKPRTKVRDLFRQYLQYGFWKVAVIRKHRIPASWRHLAPGAFVLLNLLLLFWIVAATAAGAAAARNVAAAIWSGVAGLYSLGSLAAAAIAARRAGWATLPFLPFVFAIYHFAYGLGFLAGVAYGAASGGSRRPLPRAFVTLSR